MLLWENQKEEDLPLGLKKELRVAVRGVIWDESFTKLYLIEHGENHYKFLGGKKEEGETFFQALEREIKEESAGKLLQIKSYLGHTIERRVLDENRSFEMISYYYVCSIEEDFYPSLSLEAYESDLNFKPCFITPHEAFQKNEESLKKKDSLFWTQREQKVLSFIIHTMASKKESFLEEDLKSIYRNFILKKYEHPRALKFLDIFFKAEGNMISLKKSDSFLLYSPSKIAFSFMKEDELYSYFLYLTLKGFSSPTTFIYPSFLHAFLNRKLKEHHLSSLHFMEVQLMVCFPSFFKPQKKENPYFARKAQEKDLEKLTFFLQSFHEECHLLEHPSHEEMKNSLKNLMSKGFLYVMEYKEEIIASAAISNIINHIPHLSLVYTSKEYRGQKIAQSLVSFLCEEIWAQNSSEIWLYADTSNPISTQAYASLGFIPMSQTCHHTVLFKE